MVDGIIKMYLVDKLSILNTAKHFGLGYKKTRNILLKNGIKLRKKNTKGLHKHSDDTKHKMSLSVSGEKNHNFGKKNPLWKLIIEKHRNKILNDPELKKEFYKNISRIRKEKGLSKGENNPMSKTENVEKWAKSNSNLSPNKKELKLFEIVLKLNKNYKLNTRGELIVIGNRIPDIVNINEKKIIELFGDYWHKNETKEEQDNRMNTYKNNGYSALIVWETELKNEDLLIKKLNNFI